jgi:hypothetical protein
VVPSHDGGLNNSCEGEEGGEDAEEDVDCDVWGDTSMLWHGAGGGASGRAVWKPGREV